MREINRLNDETDNQYISRLYKYKTELNLTNKELARLINSKLGTNYAESSLRGIAKYYNEGFDDGFENGLKANGSKIEIKPFTEKINFNKDGSYSSEKLIEVDQEDKLIDKNFLLKKHNYDCRDWQIVSAKSSMWDTQCKGGKIVKLYSSKIDVKPRINDISIEEIREWFKDFDRRNKTTKQIKIKSINSGLLFELPIVDLHYSRKAYSFDLGEENNCKITEQNFLKVIDDYIQRISDKNIDRILFPIGNDLLNSDTIDGSTTNGTKQNNDLGWKEMFKRGLELIIQGIDMLSEIAPVDLIYVQGNHDTMSSYYLFTCLECWFRNDDRVNLIQDFKPRRYYQWGKCLIGFAHGNKENKNIDKCMQVEEPKKWSETKYREWHLAHLHHEISKEYGGVIIRHLPSIAGVDNWSIESGYIGALQRCQAFVWDKEKGLIDIMFSNL